MAIAVHHHHPRRLLLEKQATTSRTNLSPSEATPRITHGSYNTNNNQANFDTNMVIILAALLCALICALGLNSILRCAMRCSRRFASENPDANAATAAAARLAATGIKKGALKQIPVAAFGPELNIKATDCLICLGELVDGEKIRVLPRCNHGFHVRCIDTWLLSHSSCPTCRQSLLEQPPAPENGSNDAEVAVAVVGARQDGNIPAAAAVDEDVCWSRRIRTLPTEYHQLYGLPTEWNLNYFILFFNFSYFSTKF